MNEYALLENSSKGVIRLNEKSVGNLCGPISWKHHSSTGNGGSGSLHNSLQSVVASTETYEAMHFTEYILEM